jgi:hypothetical protein
MPSKTQGGEFRGILCLKCNRMIGLAGDEPSVLSAAAKYLAERYS